MITYKFPCYPNKQQQEIIGEYLELCRSLYNFLLDIIDTPREDNHKWSKKYSQREITKLKQVEPKYKQVHSKVLQMVNYTLWGNIKGISESKKKGRKVGRLRYKPEGRYRTLNYNQSGFWLYENTVKFSKIGEFTYKKLREIEGKIKGIIIKRQSEDKYFICIQTEQEPDHLPKTGKKVGIDVGINSFAVDSDGKVFENPKLVQKNLHKLKKEQKILHRKKKGSSNYYKQKKKLGKIYEKITHQRKDYLHKVSRYYINNYDTICVEDLEITKLTKKKKKDKRYKTTLRRNIHDASWGRFIEFLIYKAEGAGREIIHVNPRNTSQACSQCGNIVKKELWDRMHECPHCGLVLDRDYNASLNILKRGMGQPPSSTELKPLSFYSSSDVVTGKVLVMT